jgi:hypothetical protein
MILEVFVPSWRKDKRTGKPMGLPGRNDTENWARSSKYGANSAKQSSERKIAAAVAKAMEEQGWERPEGKCTVTLTFVDPKPRRDEDNVMGGGSKYVIDALCTPSMAVLRSGRERWTHRWGCSAIWDDDPSHLRVRFGDVEYDDSHPGVKIVLETEEE